MKKIALFILIFFVLESCDSSKVQDLTVVTNELISENGVLISLTSRSEGESDKLTIEIQDKVSDDYLFGKIILSGYEKFKNRGLNFDLYELNDQEGTNLSFSKAEMKSIKKHYIKFEEDMELLKSKKFDFFNSRLSPKTLEQVNNSANITSFRKFDYKNLKHFEGCYFIEEQGTRYVAFSVSNNPHFVALTYELDNESSKIVAITVQ